MGSEDDLLEGIAKDGNMDYSEWPDLLNYILPRIEHIVYNDFPIPSIPLPEPLPPSTRDDLAIAKDDRPSSHGSHSSRKENVLPGSPSARQSPQTLQNTAPQSSLHQFSNSSISGPPGTLPPQLLSMLSSIQSTLRSSFSAAPPHTAQRFAELILRPTLHYRTLPSYLRALDRVLSVSSPANVFPLPSINSPSTTSNGRLLNGSTTPDPSDGPNDDFVGGAELTPIPWLNGSASLSYLSPDHPNASDLHTESTSLIDGPHGAGSLETVTVTVNGIVSANHEELLRRENDVTTSPITSQSIYGTRHTSPTSLKENLPPEAAEEPVVARGPHLIGMEDLGPQGSGPREFDIEAALGRKGDAEGLSVIRPVREEKDRDADMIMDTDADADADADEGVRGDGGKDHASRIAEGVDKSAL